MNTYSDPQVNLKGFYRQDGGGFQFEQRPWHENVWFRSPRCGYSDPQVNLKGLYGWDGGSVLFEQCFWYLKVCLVLMERVKVNLNGFCVGWWWYHVLTESSNRKYYHEPPRR